jgi:hypothetical protein
MPDIQTNVIALLIATVAGFSSALSGTRRCLAKRGPKKWGLILTKNHPQP